VTIAAIADTHAVIWSLFGDSRLSAAARAFIAHAAQSGASVGVSGMTMVEIVYLVEKGRIPRDTLERLLRLLSDPDDVSRRYLSITPSLKRCGRSIVSRCLTCPTA